MPCAHLSVQVRPGQGAGPLGRTVSESLDRSVFNITIWNMSVHETWKREHSAMPCRGETKVGVLVLSLFRQSIQNAGDDSSTMETSQSGTFGRQEHGLCYLRVRKITLRKPQTRRHK